MSLFTLSSGLVEADYAIVGLPVAIVVILLVHQLLRRVDKRHLPRGPKALPLVGNMFDMPTVQPWKEYSNWHRRYGAYKELSTMMR